MNATGIAIIVGLTSILSQTMGLREFSERPYVPFEATTFEQDALIEAAAMRGDNREETSTAACDALIADETLPFELRCWAVRQKMSLCAYARREWEALETGQEWLLDHGEADYDPLAIRYQMGQMVAYRGHDGFIPRYEDAKVIFEDLFAHHPADNLLIVQAHLDYSNFLGKWVMTNPDLHQEAVTQVGNAADALERILENNTDMTPQQRQQYEKWLSELREGYNRGLQTPAPSRAEMSEDAYVNMRLQWRKDKERVRNDHLARGWADPHIPFSSQTNTIQDGTELNTREQSQNTNGEDATRELVEESLSSDSPTMTKDASTSNQDGTIAAKEIETHHNQGRYAELVKQVVSALVAIMVLAAIAILHFRRNRR